MKEPVPPAQIPFIRCSTFPLEIDDLGVLSAQLDGHVRLRSVGLQGFRHGYDLLDERNVQILSQGQSAGAGNDRIDVCRPKLLHCSREQEGKSLLDICKMPLVVGEEDLRLLVQYGDLHGSGTDIDPKSVTFVHICGR